MQTLPVNFRFVHRKSLLFFINLQCHFIKCVRNRVTGYFLFVQLQKGQVLLQSYCASFTLLVVQQLASPVH